MASVPQINAGQWAISSPAVRLQMLNDFEAANPGLSTSDGGFDTTAPTPPTFIVPPTGGTPGDYPVPILGDAGSNGSPAAVPWGLNVINPNLPQWLQDLLDQLDALGIPWWALPAGILVLVLLLVHEKRS